VEHCPVLRVAEMSGYSKSHASDYNYERSTTNVPCLITRPLKSCKHYEDEGTATRFYHIADWTFEEQDPVLYAGKAQRRERAAGCDDFYWQRDKKADIGYIRISRDEWEKLPHQERFNGNIHTTIKPIKVNEWLSKLLLPPAQYNPRLFVPFAGVASEMIGALKAGWPTVYGVELQSEYCALAEARLSHWTNEFKQQPSLWA
jgi:hypothetical protein